MRSEQLDEICREYAKSDYKPSVWSIVVGVRKIEARDKMLESSSDDSDTEDKEDKFGVKMHIEKRKK